MSKKKRVSRNKRPLTDADRAILAKGAPALRKMLALLKKLKPGDVIRIVKKRKRR
jgi:hypothetical protein